MSSLCGFSLLLCHCNCIRLQFVFQSLVLRSFTFVPTWDPRWEMPSDNRTAVFNAYWLIVSHHHHFRLSHRIQRQGTRIIPTSQRLLQPPITATKATFIHTLSFTWMQNYRIVFWIPWMLDVRHPEFIHGVLLGFGSAIGLEPWNHTKCKKI